eukprot:g3075.t1
MTIYVHDAAKGTEAQRGRNAAIRELAQLGGAAVLSSLPQTLQHCTSRKGGASAAVDAAGDEWSPTRGRVAVVVNQEQFKGGLLSKLLRDVKPAVNAQRLHVYDESLVLDGIVRYKVNFDGSRLR